MIILNGSITLEEVKRDHRYLTTKALQLVEKKGADYNRAQQNNGDTLFNLRVARLLGIVQTDEQSILVRMSDKVMRLISLTSPEELQTPANEDEKVEDTVIDLINYAVYLYAVHTRRYRSKSLMKEENGLNLFEVLKKSEMERERKKGVEHWIRPESENYNISG